MSLEAYRNIFGIMSAVFLNDCSRRRGMSSRIAGRDNELTKSRKGMQGRRNAGRGAIIGRMKKEMKTARASFLCARTISSLINPSATKSHRLIDLGKRRAENLLRGLSDYYAV